MIYTKYTGTDSHVVLPSHEGDAPYTVIGAKAFLSRKEIESLVLPPYINQIDDWAFSHMQHLKELVLPANSIRFGKKVFMNCTRLQCIRITPDYSGNPGLPYFLADLVTVFSDMSLFDPAVAASKDSHPAWIQAYDTLLVSYLLQNDETGFEPVFYGWFNDEDPDTTQRPEYIKKQRANKVRMSFTRLRFDLHLAEETKSLLQAYLRDHMPWGSHAAEHTAVWDLLPGQYSNDVNYYHILEAAGALPPEQIPRLIEHISEADPEILAWLLRYQEQNRTPSDFFDSFSL